ncbi:MAG: alkaline phosphatase [Candidatus Rifleibacteriota bacterium]
MYKNISILLVCFALISVTVSGQQTLPAKQGGDGSSFITPVNIKPLTLDELIRKRGFLIDKPPKNIIIFYGSGFTGEAGAMFREIKKKKHEIDRMESMQLVLPEIRKKQLCLNLGEIIEQSGKALGLVSDNDFNFAASNHFLEFKTADLFKEADISFSLTDESDKEKQLNIVKKFCNRTIEFASDRKDLDRLFSGKAEKITGCFKRNDPGKFTPADEAQPFFDELVTAAISRLAVEKNGFVLLVDAGCATKSRNKQDFAQMFAHLRIQEKVMHQINYFVSGNDNTLFLVIDKYSDGYYKFSENFDVSRFEADKKNADQEMELAFIRRKPERIQPGFMVFSRGKGAELLDGMVTYKNFLKRAGVVAGYKDKNSSLEE